VLRECLSMCVMFNVCMLARVCIVLCLNIHVRECTRFQFAAGHAQGNQVEGGHSAANPYATTSRANRYTTAVRHSIATLRHNHSTWR